MYVRAIMPVRSSDFSGMPFGIAGTEKRLGVLTPRELSNKDSLPLLSLSGRESKDVGVDGLPAEVTRDSQCDAEEWDAVAGRRRSVGLSFKTVTDPNLVLLNPSQHKLRVRRYTHFPFGILLDRALRADKVPYDIVIFLA